MPYTITNKKKGTTRNITDEEYQTASQLPGFTALFKVEDILPPSKPMRRRIDSDRDTVEEPPTTNETESESATE